MTHTIRFLKASQRLLLATGLLAAVFVIGVPSVTHAAILSRQLSIGMTGSDVSALQAFLATDSSIYPEGRVTGYFGVLTKAAVMRFQSRNGISTVGRVGPITLAAINRLSGNIGGTDDVRAPLIVGASVNSARNTATVVWNTNESAKAVVHYSTSPLVATEVGTAVNVSGNAVTTDNNFRSSHAVLIQNLQSNTIYYYLIHVTDPSGNVSITWPTTFQTTN